MNRTVASVSVFLVLGVVNPVWAQEWPANPARLSLLEGQVAVLIAGASEGVAATSNLPLGPGDRVWITGPGRVEIQLPAGNLVRLGDDTSLELGAFPFAVAGAAPTRLERGMATFYLRRQPPEPTGFQVELPQATIRTSIPSTFRTNLYPDGSAQVSVYAGEVVVQTPEGRAEVRNRQTLRVGPDRRFQLYALAPWDEFDRWNDLRDIQLSRTTPASYLPTELTPYASDFVAYGHWVPVPPYGYGWAPIVEAGWSPFRHGQWITWRGEPVWLPFEPWGWVPYHYGRWLFYPAVGWVWIPPGPELVVWNPGAVAWITGPEFVAWIPLAPGEIFFGVRDFGPASVNITGVHVTNVHVTNVFVNTRVTNAVVVVHKDTFVAAGRAPASFSPPKDVFAAGGRRAIGPPPLRPAAVVLRHIPSGSGARQGTPQPSTPGRRTLDPDRPASPTVRGVERSGARGGPFVSPVERPVVRPAERPPVAAGMRPVPHQEVHQRRVTPDIRLGSPPPPAASMHRHGGRAAEVRSPQAPSPSMVPAAPRAAQSVHGGSTGLATGGTRGGMPASSRAGQGHPHPARAGGR